MVGGLMDSIKKELFRRIRFDYSPIDDIDDYLKLGGSLNIVNELDENMLIVAVKHENTRIVRYLLEQGLNKNIIDSEKRSIYYISALNYNADMFDLLLKYKVPIRDYQLRKVIELLKSRKGQNKYLKYWDELLIELKEML